MAARRSVQRKAPTALVLRDEAERLAVAAPALLIAAHRIAQTIIQGTHGRRSPGAGDDFWQYRPYTSGDPAARIDWRKSARSHKIFIRENEWAAANTLWVWASSGPGMSFRSHLSRVTKQERASLLAMALSVLAVRAGERVSALGAAFAPGHTHSTLLRMADHLTLERDQEFPTHPRLSRFSSCAFFGDFLEPIETTARRISPIAAQVQKGHIVQIVDPAEESFPYKGRTQFAEMAGPDSLVLGRVETLKADYQRTFRDHRSAVRDLAQRLGWTFTVHHTDQPPHQLLLSLYMLMADDGHGVLAPRAGVA
jgi:uncharacterized protein (DUF58 family)